MAKGQKRANREPKTPSRETVARSAETQAAEAAKTTRLRALRLAKEAADHDAKQNTGSTRTAT